MSLDPDDPTVRTAVEGQVVEDWLSTVQGRAIADSARTEIEEAVEELKTVWPLRIFKVMQLQERIRQCERFQKALADKVIDGNQAMQAIQEGDNV
jgi:hypothetical protein